MSQTLALEQAFERALEAIPARVLLGGLAVGYSGGLDSSVLLHLAARWARARALPIHALHVHHGLSPNADGWAAHCESVCAALGVPCRVMRVDVQAQEGGLEQAARHARYRALFDACGELGVSALLAAHHMNDQAETLLLNLLRGAGVAGLAGMQEQAQRTDGGEVRLLRPLLDQPRAQLQAWADLHRLDWVEDESNQALHLRRNLVRNVLLPSIEAQFPAASSVLARGAAHFRDAQQLLEQLAAIDMQAVARKEGAALDVPALSELPGERIDNLLRFWLKLQGLQAPTSAQLQDLRQQVLQAAPDRQPQIRLGHVVLHRSRGLLQLSPAVPLPAERELVLQWQGEERIAVPAWHGTLFIRPAPVEGIPAELLAGGIRIAARHGGERLRIHPQRPSRSLKNLYQEQAIPAWQRSFLPLAFSGECLLYAAGVGMDSRQLRDGPGFRLDWQSELF